MGKALTNDTGDGANEPWAFCEHQTWTQNFLWVLKGRKLKMYV